MAYRERGPNRNFRPRTPVRNHDSGGHSRGSGAQSPTTTTPTIVLKRRPPPESVPIPLGIQTPTPTATSGSALATSPKAVEKKLPPPPVILQRPQRPLETESASNAPTPLPELNAHIEQKVKEKAHPPSLAELLKPFKSAEEFAVPLIDNNMKLIPDNKFDFLTNLKQRKCKDFLVVSAIGPPKSGKSSILSYLAGSNNFGCSQIFKHRSRSEQKECRIYMGSNNVVFIEMASVFNGSAAADFINATAQTCNLENTVTSWNLRLMRLVLSISHVVLLVSENLIDANLFQLITSAEMISPMESSFGECSYPELLFICNKAPLPSITDKLLKNRIESALTSVTGRTPRIKRNVFFLPHLQFKSQQHDACYGELKEAMANLNTYFLAPFAKERVHVPQDVSLYDWFRSVNRFWDELHQPNYFTNYVKLLP